MSGLMLPHRVDVYKTDTSGNLTLARVGIAAWVDRLPPGARVGLRSVSENALARLWLESSAQSVVRTGSQVFWRDETGTGTWWTVRGSVETYGQGETAHVEALVAANANDGLFEGVLPQLALIHTFTDVNTMTGARVEVSTAPDFATTAINAFSNSDTAGWLYDGGSGIWLRFPSGGLVTGTNQTVAYAPSSFPSGPCFVRWTAYAGTTSLRSEPPQGMNLDRFRE